MMGLFYVMVSGTAAIGAVVLGWWDAEHVTLAQVIALIGVISMVALVQLEPRWLRKALLKNADEEC